MTRPAPKHRYRKTRVNRLLHELLEFWPDDRSDYREAIYYAAEIGFYAQAKPTTPLEWVEMEPTAKIDDNPPWSRERLH
jgi:hypothetical protein